MSKESRDAAEARRRQKVHEVADAMRKEVHNQHDTSNPLKDSLAAIHAERKTKAKGVSRQREREVTNYCLGAKLGHLWALQRTSQLGKTPPLNGKAMASRF